MSEMAMYHPPLALTIIASIFIGLAGLASIWIAWDIRVRRGWRSMMGVMLPVYVLNALYLAPITLWTYLKYGRPMTPEVLREWIKENESGGSGMSGHDMSGHMHAMQRDIIHEKKEGASHEGRESHDVGMVNGDMAEHNRMNHDAHDHHMDMEKEIRSENDLPERSHKSHVMSRHDPMHHEGPAQHRSMEKEMENGMPPEQHHDGHAMSGDDHMSRMDIKIARETPTYDHAGHNMGHMQHGTGAHNMSLMNHDMSKDPHMFNMMRDRPMFATVTVAVCHCGAGCLLGDIVGEWLVYGTNAEISGKGIWPEFLIDYGFALLIGIIFQYFSIAPMSGEYGPKTIYRAAKADFLSLTFFEIGLFGWMAIFQIAVFDWKLQTNNVVYWWMMQIGMFLGHWTAFPINWWLITSGIKEPCA